MAKLPKPDPRRIRAVVPNYANWTAPLWRLHRTSGAHALAWNSLREFGPLTSARFDPWPPPPMARPQDGVGYFAADWPTIFAEVFQETRTIDTSSRAYSISGFEPTRSMELLDLTGGYPIQIGASHAINGGRRDHARAWATALRGVYPGIDGLRYQSSMTGKECAALFAPAMAGFPGRPQVSRSLNDPAIRARVVSAAQKIGYRLI